MKLMKKMKEQSIVEKNQSLNTKNSESKSISSIIDANIGKRLIASLLDGFLSIFLFLFFSIICLTPIANNAFNYSGLQSLGLQYQTASHLYVFEQGSESGDKFLIEVKDYTEKINGNYDNKIISLANREDLEPSYYLEHLHYYYTSFLTGENIEMPTNTSTHTYNMVDDHFVSPDYMDKNSDNLLPKDVYNDKWFNEEILKVDNDGSDFFETNDINVLATIKDNIDVKKCEKYLRNLLNSASADLYYRSYYQDINNNIKYIQLFIVLPSFVVTLCLVYLLPTMLFKNGETLGKRFMHLAVIGSNGYKAKKRQYVYRFLVFFLEIGLSTFIVGIGFTSIATLCLGVLILFIATLISKSHRSLHDYLAMTLVVDANKSVWFDSYEDEQQKIKELNEKMEKYKKVKVENKNIIQVGSTIIDENFAKKQKSNNKNK